MAATWEQIISSVEAWDDSGRKYTTKFYRIRVLDFLKQAKKWGISPDKVENITRSNLREIIWDAAEAIRNDDKAHLEELFDKAKGDIKTYQLRILLKRYIPEDLTITKTGKEENALFTMTLTKKQFDRIKGTLTKRFKVKMIEK